MAEEFLELPATPAPFITMIVAKADLPVAQKLFRALDPDVGGYESFGTELADGSFLASMPMTSLERKQFESLQVNSVKMEEYVKADYNKRWAPTAEEKEQAKTDPVAAEKQKELPLADVLAIMIASPLLVGSVKEAFEEIAKKGRLVTVKDRTPLPAVVK